MADQLGKCFKTKAPGYYLRKERRTKQEKREDRSILYFL